MNHLADVRPTTDMAGVLERQRRSFLHDGPPGLAQRRAALARLKAAVLAFRTELEDAVSADFGHRSRHETGLMELAGVVEAIGYLSRRLRRFMKPERRHVGLLHRAGRAHVEYQPLGVVGVMSPWNYPVSLTLIPLATALAAGNRAMVKPSELTPRTSEVMRQLLASAFSDEEVAVVIGGPEEGARFSGLPFDHLFFTGSTPVGRKVMVAAARNLVPVTLELGGKSPLVVARGHVDERTLRSVVFGKLANAGQTCVAPDYVLVPEERIGGFVEAYRQAVRGFYPTLADNPDYTAIINERQLARLNSYLSDATSKGALLIPLFDQGQGRRMPHSLLLNVSDEMTVMQDEIFGPLLPIVPYQDLDQAFAYINQRPRPLALYYFGYDKHEQKRVLSETHSGGVCLNDTLLHVAQDDMPFGGIGPSGMGHYHGHEGFLTFSKAKGVLVKQRFNAAKLIYPPYGKPIQKLIQKLFIR